ncbi:MAG: T9SS type A sorting domain-containing protein [Flavobacteriales bacterium]|nr:T9SS type A sorting domain-containing protein [Flavobacteriales bacterium]
MKNVLTIGINHPDKKSMNLTVLNLLGEEVYVKALPKNSTNVSIDLSNLSVGLYILRLADGVKADAEYFIRE